MTQGPQDKKALGRIALQRSSAGQQSSHELTEGDVTALKALSEQHGVPGIDLAALCLRLSDLDLLPREIAEKHAILPVLVRDDRVFIAMVSPGDRHIIDELEFVTGKKVYPYVALPSELQRVLSSAYAAKNRGEAYYVGPRCPQEMLDRMGVSRDGTVVTETSGPPRMSAGSTAAHSSVEEPTLKRQAAKVPERASARQRPEAPSAVVDDATGRAARATDVSDADFPNTSEELSQVGSLPTDPGNPTRSQLPPGTRTILVVDDEADIRKMLKRLLTDRGFHVLEADRGLLALRMVKERVPDLIVLDAMLPEVHGFEIARRIKGSQRYGHIPIIMISAVYRGWRYAEDVKASYGVNAYLEKPFRIAELMKTIETVMAAGTSERPEEGQTSSGAEKALADGVAAYQAGDIDLAIQHLQRGVGIDPLAYRLHFHLGLLYGKKGMVYEAIQELETALHINAKHFPAMKNLAVLYQKAGFRNKAIEMWERAIPVAPDEATRLSIKELLLGLL